MEQLKVCLVCGIEYTPSKYKPNQKVCSTECRVLYNARISAPKRGDSLRDRGVGKTYRKLRGRHEHRVVAEIMLGRSLTKDEVVHHKDGNKRNNDPANLEILTRAEHASRHNKLYNQCLIDGCSNKPVARNLCDTHYCRLKRGQSISDDGSTYIIPPSTKRYPQKKAA